MDRHREQRRSSCRDVGKLDFAQQSMKDYVSMANPINEPFEGMDMKVHLILKPTEKSKNRHISQSLSRTQSGKIQNNVLFSEDNRTNSRRDKDNKNLAIESKNTGKNWNDILVNHEVPPPRKNNRACNRRSHSASPEPELIDDETVGRKRHSKHLLHEEKSKDMNQANTDVNAFSLLNPVRSIHFLVNELRSLSQPLDGRQQGIFKILEQVLLKLPENSPQGCGAKCSTKHEANNPVTQKHSNQYSRTGYETMRKERDSLQKQLNDKTKSHIVLERKVATLEARLLRVKSERDELRGVNEKMIAEQKSLLATLNSRGNETPDSRSKNQLIEELNSAHEYISKLQAGMLMLEKQYSSKMKEVQGILHDGFDSSKNDSVNLENILGRPPEEEPSLVDLAQFSLPTLFPDLEVRPDSPVPPPIASPALAPTKDPCNINIDQFINNLLQQSGLPKEEQVSIFQSFISIPDYQAPTTENS